MFFDPMYLLYIAPGLILGLIAQAMVKSTFARYSRIGARRGISGAETALEVMAAKGIHDVQVEEVGGFLSDHYDPRSRVLRLSPDVYRGRSLASLGVAAHEAGHALQDAQGYLPMRLRAAVVQPAMLGQNFSYVLVILGFMMHLPALMWAGVLLFGLALVFTIVTLPVEFDASARAMRALADGRVLDNDELHGARKVLSAAALTYVAAVVSALGIFLYYLSLANRRD